MMDAVILAEKVVEDMDYKTLYTLALETLIDYYGEMSVEERTKLAEDLGYGDDV